MLFLVDFYVFSTLLELLFSCSLFSFIFSGVLFIIVIIVDILIFDSQALFYSSLLLFNHFLAISFSSSSLFLLLFSPLSQIFFSLSIQAHILVEFLLELIAYNPFLTSSFLLQFPFWAALI